MTELRWGILGAAKIALTDVMPAIHLSKRGRVQAVASRSAKRVAGYEPIAHYTDYNSLINDPDVDAIYIPLPNHMHVEWTKRAAEAGKHVLCEKPIAWDAAQVDELIGVRDRTGKLIAEAFMVCHHPQWHLVRDLLAEGTIGKLVHVQGAFAFFNDDGDNIRNRAETEGGALGDIGVYPSVTTRFVTGAEPVSATAKLMMENGVDVTARTMVDFDGFALDFHCSMRMAPHQSMTFHGTRGVIEVPAPFNARKFGEARVIVRRGHEAREHRFPEVEQYLRQMDAFNAAVLDGTDFPVTLEFSRGNAATIDMIRVAGA